MTSDVVRLPSRKWSIVALGSAGMAAVLISYALVVAVAAACLILPVVMFVVFPLENGNLFIARVLISAFGIAAGLTILWSIVPRRNKVEINGVLIDLSKEPRLAKQIESIAQAMNEPMPSEVYLVGDANAFVIETSGFLGFRRRRIIGLGLPLLQMLTIAQFRAVLAHEFGHYYAGDTRMGPWVYNTRITIARVYENLGRKSAVISFLTRWAVVSIPYMALMGAMRLYWNLFMRITQWISRRQEFRSDELACHVAGSQALMEGLQGIRRCQAALNTYWTSVVLPVAAGGFQPQLADGFMRFMNTPHVAKAAAEFLAKQSVKASPMDTHPPLCMRVERARNYNLSAPNHPDQSVASDLPMISLIDDLTTLEGGLLRRFVPDLANKALKQVSWDSAGRELQVPRWRKQLQGYAEALSTTTLQELPILVRDPQKLLDKAANPSATILSQAQRDKETLQVLYCALALCLLDNGWTLFCPPGIVYLESPDTKLDPGEVINDMKTGKLSLLDWCSQCSQNGMNDWPLARIPTPAQV